MTSSPDDIRIEAEQHQQAEALAAGLPALLVAAKRVAATVSQGVHGRRTVGQGETFWQFRRYETGDSRDRIDWRQSAKSDHLYIRETEWEAAQSVWLWADLSGSMLYRSADHLPSKAERAVLLTMALGWMLVGGGERIALLGSEKAPGAGRSAMNQMVSTLASRAVVTDRLSLPVGDPVPRYARVCLLGDFLSPLNDIRHCLEGLAAQGVRGHLFQIQDPAEYTLPFRGRIQFDGLEGEGSVLVGRAETLSADFCQAMEKHNRSVAALARSLGWSYAAHSTDQSPESALLALYARLSTPTSGPTSGSSLQVGGVGT